jgi:hypothetical protein
MIKRGIQLFLSHAKFTQTTMQQWVYFLVFIASLILLSRFLMSFGCNTRTRPFFYYTYIASLQILRYDTVANHKLEPLVNNM